MQTTRLFASLMENSPTGIFVNDLTNVLVQKHSIPQNSHQPHRLNEALWIYTKTA